MGTVLGPCLSETYTTLVHFLSVVDISCRRQCLCKVVFFTQSLGGCSFYLLPSTSFSPSFPSSLVSFALHGEDQTQGEEKQETCSALYPSLLSSSSPPTRRWKGDLLPQPAAWQVAALLSMFSSFPLFSLP